MKKDLVTTEIVVKENKVEILKAGNINYISLTDLARYQNSSDPSFTVKNWLKGERYSIGTFAHPDIAFEFASQQNISKVKLCSSYICR